MADDEDAGVAPGTAGVSGWSPSPTQSGCPKGKGGGPRHRQSAPLFIRSCTRNLIAYLLSVDSTVAAASLAPDSRLSPGYQPVRP